MRGDGGFTLVEILIVVVMGIILAGVVVPAAVNLDDQRVAADARILAADVEFVQARAIATGQTHRVKFDLEAGSWAVESPPGVVIAEPLTRRDWVRVLTGSTLEGVDFGGRAALLFDGAGTPGNGGSVTLRSGEFVAQVGVAAVTGVVTVVLP